MCVCVCVCVCVECVVRVWCVCCVCVCCACVCVVLWCVCVCVVFICICVWCVYVLMCVCHPSLFYTGPLIQLPPAFGTPRLHILAAATHSPSHQPTATFPARNFKSVRLHNVFARFVFQMSPWMITILVLFLCTTAAAVVQLAVLTALCALYRRFGSTYFIHLFMTLTWTNENVGNTSLQNPQQTKHTAPYDNTKWPSLSLSASRSSSCAVAIAVQLC